MWGTRAEPVSFTAEVFRSAIPVIWTFAVERVKGIEPSSSVPPETSDDLGCNGLPDGCRMGDISASPRRPGGSAEPRLAIAVVMEHQGSGSDFATPVAQQVLRVALPLTE